MGGAVLLIIIVQLVMFALAGLIMWRVLASHRAREAAVLANGPQSDATGAAVFPVRGIKYRSGVLMNKYSHNSVNPAFALTAEGVRVRIFRTVMLPYREMDGIDARRTITGIALIFMAEGRRRVLVARFGDAAIAARVLVSIPPSAPLTEAAALARDGTTTGAAVGLGGYRGRIN